MCRFMIVRYMYILLFIHFIGYAFNIGVCAKYSEVVMHKKPLIDIGLLTFLKHYPLLFQYPRVYPLYVHHLTCHCIHYVQIIYIFVKVSRRHYINTKHDA